MRLILYALTSFVKIYCCDWVAVGATRNIKTSPPQIRGPARNRGQGMEALGLLQA